MGRGSRYPVAIAPVKFSGNKVVHVDGGTEYTMVVTEDSSLWACGHGHNGCLGIGILDDIAWEEVKCLEDMGFA